MFFSVLQTTNIYIESLRGKSDSLIHQTRQVFISHSPYPLVNVVEVHQQKLGMALQLLFILLGLSLDREDRYCRLSRVPQQARMALWWALPYLPSCSGRHQTLCQQQQWHTASSLKWDGGSQGLGIVTKITNNLKLTELQSSTVLLYFPWLPRILTSVITSLHLSKLGNGHWFNITTWTSAFPRVSQLSYSCPFLFLELMLDTTQNFLTSLGFNLFLDFMTLVY